MAAFSQTVIDSQSCCQHRAQRGFTLIELIMVTIVLAILAGAAVPTLSTMSAARSGMAAKQVLRDMSFARQRAISTGTGSWVVFNTSVNTWSILAENPASPGRAGATVLNDMATGRPYTTALNTGDYAGVTVTSCNFGGGTEVGFNWLGKPLITSGAALASQGSVTLSGGNSVTVQAGSGHIAYVGP